MSADPPADPRPVIDGRAAAPVAERSSVDDRVRGGVSASRIAATAEGLVFTGEVSLAPNGGFASIRSSPREYGLAGATALLLRVRGDGQTDPLTVRTAAAFDGGSYQARFATQAGGSRRPPRSIRPGSLGSGS